MYYKTLHQIKQFFVQHVLNLATLATLSVCMLLVGLYHTYFFTSASVHNAVHIVPLTLKKLVKKIPTPEEYQWQSTQIRKKDTLTKVFKRLEVNNPVNTINKINQSKIAEHYLGFLKPGSTIFVHLDEAHNLENLRYPIDSFHDFVINEHEGEYNANLITVKLEPHVHFVTGVIKNSLYTAAMRARLPIPLIEEFAHVLSWDIDFAHDIQPKDHFTVLYTDYYDHDRRVSVGHIIAAEFTTHNQKYRFIRYTDPTGRTDYYTPAGNSVQRAFTRTPVKFTRISSRFNLRRRHPILDIIRPHRGVDYAAPTGTPVKATADGAVIFKGRKGGYGKVVKLDHGKDYCTLYAHLSKFAKNLKKGQSIKQGQVIAYVGQTGAATGPHLHYEFRIKNVYHDPLKVALPAAHPIDKKYRRAFITRANDLLAQLDLYRTATLASQNKQAQL